MEDQTTNENAEREKLVAAAVEKGLAQDVAEQMDIEQLRSDYGEPATEKTPPEPADLMDMSLEQLSAMSDKALKKLCKAEEMTTDGAKEDRFNRLYAKRFGLTSRYIGQETRCQFCGQAVQVKGTVREPQADGRVLITRSMKCVGQHKHIYPLSQFEGKSVKK